MSRLHKDITVYGKVQGVGFRYNCKRTAQMFGLKGYVKNLVDGSVYIEVEGNEININQFIRWCHDGPAHARVDKVEFYPANLIGFTSFDIK